MFPESLIEQAHGVAEACLRRRLKVATAESCTGGMVAACLTEVAGVSEVFVAGFVAYANTAKVEELGVDETLIVAHGAVSAEVARAMAEGALDKAGAQLAVSTTGIAGPSGGTADKPVGLVHLAAARRGGATLHERHLFKGDRTAVRVAATSAALALLKRAAEE